LSSEINTIRLLGATQFFVIVLGIIGAYFIETAVGTGSISEILVNISQNERLLRIGNLVVLVESVLIVVLGVLFYSVFKDQYNIISLVALCSFLAEAITKAAANLGTWALIPLSQEFVSAGTPDPSYFLTLGDFLYYGLDKKFYEIHMLFFCFGAILFYYLFYITSYIPRWLSIWGLASVCLLAIPTLFVLYDPDFLPGAIVLALPYFPFEFALGLWLMIKGVNLS